MKKIFYLYVLLALPALSFSQISNPAPYCDPVYDVNYNMFDVVAVKGSSLNFGTQGSFGNTDPYLYFNTSVFPDFVIGDTASIELNVYAVNDIEPLYFALWIDFDQSNTFDPGELVMQNSNTINAALPFFGATVTPINKIITIPSGASLGNTRVRLMRGSNVTNPFAPYDNTLILDPCPTPTGMGFGFLGCTYDFDINIVCPPSYSTDTQTACDSLTWIDGNTYTSSNNTSTFNVSGGAANGCDSIVTLDLTINNVTNLTTSVSGTIITANNTGATYQWLDCDNNNSIILGETGQSYTGIANGNYAVELFENGCVDTSACVAITTVGILENNFSNEFKLYPNPTNSNFSIDLGESYPTTSIIITDLLGKTIQTNEFTNNQILNLKIDEPAGIYLLKIESGNQKVVIRLVKE